MRLYRMHYKCLKQQINMALLQQHKKYMDLESKGKSKYGLFYYYTDKYLENC